MGLGNLNPFKSSGNIWQDAGDTLGGFFNDALDTLGGIFEGIGDIINKVGSGLDKVISGVMKDPLPVIAAIGLTAMGVPPTVVALLKGAAQGGSMDQMVFNMAAGYVGAEIGSAVGAEFFPDTAVAGGFDPASAMETQFQITDATNNILRTVISNASARGAASLLQGK